MLPILRANLNRETAPMTDAAALYRGQIGSDGRITEMTL